MVGPAAQCKRKTPAFTGGGVVTLCTNHNWIATICKKPNPYHTAMKKSLCPDAGLKDTGTKAYLRERILGGLF